MDPAGTSSSQYKITSYNTSGESYDVQIVSPLSVSISGPTYVVHPEKGQPVNNYTWNAVVSGGQSPYNYTWYKNGSQVGTSSSYSEQYTYDGAGGGTTQFTLRIDATDVTSQLATANMVITEQHSGGIPPISPPSDQALSINLMPEQFALSQNYPNPFNPETEISFALPEQSQVRITIADVLGREVRRLQDGELSAGFHRVRWNGLDGQKQKVGSGVYFYRITATGSSGKAFSKTMKMALTK